MTQDPKETAQWVVSNGRSPYHGTAYCTSGYYSNDAWVFAAQWAIDADDYSEIAEMLALEDDYDDFRDWQRDIPAREAVIYDGWESWA